MLLIINQTLNTYTEFEANQILNVEDTGRKNDSVIIKNRETLPIREDIITAYRLLYAKGKLERQDLSWLAEPSKKTSSIDFRIEGEIDTANIKVEKNKVVVLRLKNV